MRVRNVRPLKSRDARRLLKKLNRKLAKSVQTLSRVENEQQLTALLIEARASLSAVLNIQHELEKLLEAE